MNIKRQNTREGFALPTVLIASVVMMMVLLTGLTATTSTSAAIKSQYVSRLTQSAAESGLKMAKACFDKNPYATWTQLSSNTDCTGTALVNCTTSPADNRCSVSNNGAYKTTFTVGAPVASGNTLTVNSTGQTALLRSSGVTASTVTTSLNFKVSQLRSAIKDRATQRYWQLGHNGSTRLDFGTSGSPTPVLSKIDTSATAPDFVEGMTTVTDPDGKYLFSSNGIGVWDINNKAMPGANAGLGADGSTSQGVIAFPIPGSNRYVIITNSAGSDASGATGYGVLTKSIVNMDLIGSNGSIGDVEAGSIMTLTRAYLNGISPAAPIATSPNNEEEYMGQYMTAAPESSGKGYWIVFGTPGRAYFYAILIGSDGNVKKTVRSSTPAGIVIPACKMPANLLYRVGFGTVRFNNNYDEMVIASGAGRCTYNAGQIPASYDNAGHYNLGWIYLRSFDASTGVIGDVYSQGASQYFYGPNNCVDSAELNSGYSADFSPDENYIYFTSIYPGRLYRFRITGADLDAGTQTVDKTVQYISNTDNYNGTYGNNPAYPQGGQVRRAPNGKMYVANIYSTNISVLSTLDGSTAAYSTACGTRAAGFSYNSFSLGGTVQGGLGLPDYETRYYPSLLYY